LHDTVCGKLDNMAGEGRGTPVAGTPVDEALAKPEEKTITLKEFLEDVPPGREVLVGDAIEQKERFSPPQYYIQEIDIDLYCPTPVKCEGIRSFHKVRSGESIVVGTHHQSVHIRFCCRNCQKSIKLYSLLVRLTSWDACTFWKLAETPDFGPPTPAKLIKIIGPEKDYYLKGRRCENQGLGIGAFGYYRRVVENQKNRIIDEIIRAAKKINAPKEMLDSLEATKTETQFTTAIDRIRPAVPEALLISGHNPLTLLHSALSQGLHAETDEECLELATSIRVVLDDLAERTTAVLKDSAELSKALSRLMQWKAKK
jgi:hypothetical protein